MSRYLTTAFLFLAVQLSSVSARGSAAACREVFESPKVTELAYAVISKNHHGLERNIELIDKPYHSFVDGMHAEKLQNNPGLTNKGIYFLERDGSKRLVKLYNEPYADATFERFLKGVALASRVGGPKLYSFGRATNADGKKFFYMEIEHVLPHQETVLLKDMTEGNGNAESKAFFRNKKFIHSFAESTVTLIEHKVAPSDLDYMVAKSGDFRFMDTDFWRPHTEQYSFPFRELIMDLRKVDNSAGETYKAELRRLISKSKKISNDEKILLLNELEIF